MVIYNKAIDEQNRLLTLDSFGLAISSYVVGVVETLS